MVYKHILVLDMIPAPITFDNQFTYRMTGENNGVRLSYATGYKAPLI